MQSMFAPYQIGPYHNSLRGHSVLDTKSTQIIIISPKPTRFVWKLPKMGQREAKRQGLRKRTAPDGQAHPISISQSVFGFRPQAATAFLQCLHIISTGAPILAFALVPALPTGAGKKARGRSGGSQICSTDYRDTLSQSLAELLGNLGHVFALEPRDC